MKNTILVAGATGMLGQPVAYALQTAGFNIRILSRDTEKAAKLFNNTFEIAEGDVLQPATLVNALMDCYGVYINLSGETEASGVKNIIEIAKQNDVKRIGYISGSTVTEENRWFPMIENKYQAEKAIVESGLEYHIFRCSWFYDSLPNFVRDGKAFLVGKQEKLYHWISSQDYISMVTAAFLKDETTNKIFYIFGPEYLTIQQALEKYCKFAHPEITKVKAMPPWLAKIIALFVRKKSFDFVLSLFDYFSKTDEDGNADETYRLLGNPKLTIEKWVELRK